MAHTLDSGRSAKQEKFLEVVYRANYSSLLVYVRKFTLGDVAKAEDIVQETMMRAWQHIDDFGPSHESVRPWLFTVAHRIAIDRLRASAVRPTEVRGDLMEILPAAGDGIDQAMTAIDVRAVLACLSPHHRAVLVHLYLLDRTILETAALMDIPPGTVKSRAFNALRAARRALDALRAAREVVNQSGGQASPDSSQASKPCRPGVSPVDAMKPA